MGKIRTRTIGLEEEEKKEKAEQKRKSGEKKLIKKKKTDQAKNKVDVKKVDKPVKKAKAVKIAKAAPRGKNYQTNKKLFDRNKTYTLSEALKLLKKMKMSNFNESVELHLNVDQTGLKGEVDLPNPTGKTMRIKIVDDKVLVDIEKGKLEFDLLVTHPSFMPKLAKFAKILGPKGLMPNPKAGTISPKPEDLVKKYEKGALRWKTEVKFPLIHQMIGKVSFEDKKLIENTESFLKSVGKSHILKAVIKTTMSPGIKLNIE